MLTGRAVRIASLCDTEQRLLKQRIIAFGTTVESKPKGDCISMKTKKVPYDAGFQVCGAAASQNAGIHERSGIDACRGNRRYLGHFRADQWRAAEAGGADRARRGGECVHG